MHFTNHLCIVSTHSPQVNVYVHSVYKMCTMSPNYARRLATTCMHRVYRLYSSKQTYATFFFTGGGGASYPILNIVSSHRQRVHCIYNMCSCRPPMHSVYKQHPCKCVCAHYLQTVHIRIMYSVHSVYGLYSGKRTYPPFFFGGGGALRPILTIVSSCQQHVHSVHHKCLLYTTYAQCLQTLLG